MLAASAAFLALLGVGFVMLPSDDDDEMLNAANDDGAESFDDMPEDDLEVVSLDSFLDGDASTDEEDAPAEAPVEDEEDESAEAPAENDDDEGLPPEERVARGLDEGDAPVGDEDEPEDEDTSEDEEETPSNVIAGGPGDTLVGGPALDTFDVTVGAEGDPETVIQNLFEISEDADTGEPDFGYQIETIWLRDDMGELISREDLLASDMHLQEDEDRGGVTMSLNGHSTLFVEDVSLEDFTQNSLIIGNFQMAHRA